LNGTNWGPRRISTAVRCRNILTEGGSSRFEDQFKILKRKCQEMS